MRWLVGACLLLGCSSDPFVIGRYVPVSTDGGIGPAPEDGGSSDDGCQRAHANALVCSGFEAPLADDFSELVETRTGELERSREQVFEGEHALHASTDGAESSAVVSARFAPVSSGELFVRVMVYVPSGLSTEIMNLFFLGDDAAMNDDFEGLDVNVVDDQLQVFAPQSSPSRIMGTSSLPRDTWFCLRMRVGLDDEAGDVSMWLDDELALSGSGLDTLPDRGARQFRAGIDWSSEQDDWFEVYMDALVLDTAPVACP